MNVAMRKYTDRSPPIDALVVEDDDLDAQLLTTFAGMSGHLNVRFTRARSVSEAMRLTRSRRFDMYFVDLHIGGGSSLRLLATLADEGLRPVVVSNATAAEVERYRLDSAGVRFLSKPDCSAASIGALVREALAARAASTR